MKNFELLYPADEQLLQVIHKELGEDPDRLKNRQQLFKQWIDCEDHLPKNIDQRIIDNFIRGLKFDIERAKNKFEVWLYARTKYRSIFSKPSNDKQLTFRRRSFCARRLTEDGYRVVIISFRNTDSDSYDYEQHLRYCYLYLDYILLNDVFSGCKIIFDMNGFNAQALAKINLTLFKAASDVLVNAQPVRIREIHLLNLPKLAQGLYMLATSVLTEKIKKRIYVHKDVSAILDYIKPNSILPNEYGGSDGRLEDLQDNATEILLNDETFCTERDNWVLAGEFPSEKRKMYNFEDRGTAGSFRQLQID